MLSSPHADIIVANVCSNFYSPARDPWLKNVKYLMLTTCDNFYNTGHNTKIIA